LTSDPSQITLSLAQGQTSEQKIYIDSNSTQATNVQAAVAGGAWLVLNTNLPTSGSVYSGNASPFFFDVVIGSPSTTPGSYNGQISVTSSAGNINIPVSLTVTPPPGPTQPRVGQLVNNNGTVVYVGNGGIYGIPDLPTFDSWGFSFSQVLPANGAEQALPQIGVIPTKKSGCNTPLDQIAGTCGN
jgi:hypothetical protein